jgi:glycosyltransferase involved in cell wall biosynthesis
VRITWGVDLTCFRPHRRLESFQDRFNLPQHATVFLDCRAAQPLYNKHIIIRAFADLVARYSQLDLILLISEFNAVPRYLKQLHELVAALGLQAQVRFLPRLSEEDMADCYCAANATICVPSSDGFPQTVYEALACESALILGNLPQYEELPTSELPIQIVPVGDVPALSRAMATICQARDASPTTAAQGRAFVSRVADAAAESRKVNQLYGQLLNTAAAP